MDLWSRSKKKKCLVLYKKTVMSVHTFDAPVDSILCRPDGLVIVCLSNVFGNTWDGGIVVIPPGNFGQDTGIQKTPTPSGCTDAALVDSTGNTIAVSCDDGNVAIYCLDGYAVNGIPIKLLTDHENSVTALSSSPAQAGSILSASMDHTIISSLLDGSSTSFVHEYKGVLSSFPTPTFSTLRVIPPRACAAGHHGAVWDVEHSPTSPTSFASAGQDGAVRLWDERERASTAALPHPSPMFCVAWLPSAPLLAAAGEQGEVLVYDVRATQVPRRRAAPRDTAAPL